MFRKEMNKKKLAVTIVVFTLCAAGIALFALRSSHVKLPFGAEWKPGVKNNPERYRTRIIVPGLGNGDSGENTAWMENADDYTLKAPLDNEEQIISAFNIDFYNDSIEEQIVAFRSRHVPQPNPSEGVEPELRGSPLVSGQVSIAYLSYDEQTGAYRRSWNAPTAASMPGTVSLYTLDLLGDRMDCVILTGMNAEGKHTLTAFQKTEREDLSQPFIKIAEIQVDGSINIQQAERPLAYRQGIAKGQPFTIIAYGQDGDSDNVLDRIEIEYAYNPARRFYEPGRITRIPGSQIEQRRVREILSGNRKVFEEFINDLWYHVSPMGTIDRNQYLYFDPANREIIFYGEDTQQVFSWQHSNTTRYGLYITSQNIAVTTLRRFIDIELESLDSIRMKVSEDVRLKINISASWDGSYRRAGKMYENDSPHGPYTEASYDSSMGRLRFYPNGDYELNSQDGSMKGRYAFFRVNDKDMLELRPDHAGNSRSTQNNEDRMIYRITGQLNTTENLSLLRVRLGPAGIQELQESQIYLTKVR
jgi:hypothetical protein